MDTTLAFMLCSVAKYSCLPGPGRNKIPFRRHFASETSIGRFIPRVPCPRHVQPDSSRPLSGDDRSLFHVSTSQLHILHLIYTCLVPSFAIFNSRTGCCRAEPITAHSTRHCQQPLPILKVSSASATRISLRTPQDSAIINTIEWIERRR